MIYLPVILFLELFRFNTFVINVVCVTSCQIVLICMIMALMIFVWLWLWWFTCDLFSSIMNICNDAYDDLPVILFLEPFRFNTFVIHVVCVTSCQIVGHLICMIMAMIIYLWFYFWNRFNIFVIFKMVRFGQIMYICFCQSRHTSIKEEGWSTKDNSLTYLKCLCKFRIGRNKSENTEV